MVLNQSKCNYNNSVIILDLKKRLAFSSTAAIALGLVIMLAPTLLFSGQFEQLGSRNGKLMGEPTPMFTPVPGESTDKSFPTPFMSEFNLDSSYGFEKIYLLRESYGTPVFVLTRGESATIAFLVSSLSDNTIQVSLERVDGLPLGVSANLEPKSFTLQPFEQRELRMKISVSPTARTLSPHEPRPINAEFIQLVLKSDGYDVGTGFLLEIT